MGIPLLTRTTTLLKLNDEKSHLGNQVEFLSDEEGRDTSLYLDRKVWSEMGMPEQVTLSVVPGDNLND